MRLMILAFACGVILVQQLAALPPSAWSTVAAAGACVIGGASFLGLRPGRARAFILLLAAASLGASFAALRAEHRLASALPSEWEGRDVSVVGVVAEMAQPFARGERFVFTVEQVLTAGAVVPERVMLSWYRQEPGADGGRSSTAPIMVPGDRWQLTVRLKRPHGNANPGGFDYEAWLFERDIRATGYVRVSPPPVRTGTTSGALLHFVERWRHEIRERFLQALGSSDYAGVLVALAVGDQRAIQGEFWRVFAATGTTHLMSISGLHVTMVAAMLAAFVGFLWRRSPRLMHRLPAQKAAIIAGWLGAVGYAMLAGFSVPAQRTAYMLTVVALAMLSGRRAAGTQVLLLALLLVLLIDPWAVLAPGFWLSFGAVSLLFYVSSGRQAVSGGWKRSPWQSTLQWGRLQWAVTIGSLPLLLFFFQQFSLVSPLANAVAIPVISLVVTPLALLAIVLPIPLLLDFAHGVLALVMQLLILLADLPLYEQPAPPVWSIVLAVGGVGVLLLPRGFPVRWVGAIMLLPALLHVPPRPSHGEVGLTVLDVGQGLAVVVQTATKTLLYDAGPLYSAESDVGQRIVVPYLRANGIRRIDTMIVTHSDSDHAGGAASVLASLPVDRLLSSIDEMPGEACAAGLEWNWDGVRFLMLHPVPGETGFARRLRPNNRSCVLRIEAAGGASILLTSDIEAADEMAILGRDAGALASDVLLVPHHGSRTSSSPAFVAAVGAQHVIYPVGYRNRFGHPRPEVTARYAGATEWRTDRDGALYVELADSPEILAQRRLRLRYWHGR